MKYSEEKIDELLDASKPLIKWLSENHHPHMTVVVTSTRAELLEGQMSVICEDFLRD